MPADRSPLKPLIELVARARRTLDETLPAPSAFSSDLLAAKVAPLARDAFTAWDNLLEVIDRARIDVAVMRGDMRYADTFRNEEVAKIIATARTAAAGYVATITSSTDKAIAVLAPVGRPPMPVMDATTIALGEALKSDMKMVLDGLPSTEVENRLVQFLTDAVAAEDALSVWILAGSPWGRLYLESRGEFAIRYDQRAGDAIATGAPDSVRMARHALGVLEGRSGLKAVATAATHYTPMAFDEIVQGR